MNHRNSLQILFVSGAVAFGTLVSCGSHSNSVGLDQALAPLAPNELVQTQGSQGIVQAGVAHLTPPVTNHLRGGELRFELSGHHLPKQFSFQNVIFTPIESTADQNYVSYGADLQTALVNLDPFDHIQLPVPDGTHLNVVTSQSSKTETSQFLYQGTPQVSIEDVALVLATLQTGATTASAIVDQANLLLDSQDQIDVASLDPVPTLFNTNYVNAGEGILNLYDVAALLAQLQVGSAPDRIAARINDLLDVEDVVATDDILVVPGQGIPENTIQIHLNISLFAGSTFSRVARARVTQAGQPLQNIPVTWAIETQPDLTPSSSVTYPKSFTDKNGEAVTEVVAQFNPFDFVSPVLYQAVPTGNHVVALVGGVSIESEITYVSLVSDGGGDFNSTSIICTPEEKQTVILNSFGIVPSPLLVNALNAQIASIPNFELTTISPADNKLKVEINCTMKGSTLILVSGNNGVSKIRVHVQ